MSGRRRARYVAAVASLVSMTAIPTFATVRPSPEPAVVIAEGPGTPLILDLNGDGVLTSGVRLEAVDFDIDGDGTSDRTAWTLEQARDAFLWIDLNDNGLVDGVEEFLGSASTDPRDNPAGQAGGFEVLALYDEARFGGNGDGRIDRLDALWPRLRLWVDDNHDGASTRDEVAPLRRHRVARLGLAYESVDESDGSSNNILARGRFWLRGPGGDLRQREVVQVRFRFLQG